MSKNVKKNKLKYLVTNIEGYNITYNNIIYGDLNSSAISYNLYKHKSKHKFKNLKITINKKYS
jgi:hypothetical protein